MNNEDMEGCVDLREKAIKMYLELYYMKTKSVDDHFEGSNQY